VEKSVGENCPKGQAKDWAAMTKEMFGKATGDTQTERRGKADRVEGKGQKRVGDAKDALRGKK
jgi:uncharacterized protein YjbJ (UPF0337 family)